MTKCCTWLSNVPPLMALPHKVVFSIKCCMIQCITYESWHLTVSVCSSPRLITSPTFTIRCSHQHKREKCLHCINIDRKKTVDKYGMLTLFTVNFSQASSIIGPHIVEASNTVAGCHHIAQKLASPLKRKELTVKASEWNNHQLMNSINYEMLRWLSGICQVLHRDVLISDFVLIKQFLSWSCSHNIDIYVPMIDVITWLLHDYFFFRFPVLSL